MAEESAILLYAGAMGLEMGLMYDFFRILRRVWNCNFFVTACMDLGFWCFVAGRTFYVMHTYSNGTLRWFAVLGVLVIVFFYLKFFSRYVVMLGVFVFSRIKVLLDVIKKCLTKILKLPIIKIRKVFRKGNVHDKKSSISDTIP